MSEIEKVTSNQPQQQGLDLGRALGVGGPEIKEVDKAVKYAYGVTMADVVMTMQEQSIDSDKVFDEQDTFYADVLICTEKEEYAIYSKQILYCPMDD